MLLAVFVSGCASSTDNGDGGGAGAGGFSGFIGGFAGDQAQAGTFGGAGMLGFAGMEGLAGVGGAAGASGNSAFGGGSGGVGGTAGVAGASGTGGMAGMAGTVSLPDALLHGPDPTKASAGKDGTFTWQKYTTGWTDSPAYAGATIYYPTNADPPFAGIAIVPGFTAYQSSIADWGPFLASHGIVVMTIDTNTTGDQPPLRSAGLLAAVETMKAENTRSGSPLMGKVEVNRMAVAGWSMGGGGTLITLNGHPELKAGISFCGWNPGGTYPTNKVPALLIASEGDPLAGGQSQGFYTSIPATTPKILFETPGANHNVGNSPKNLSGEIGVYGLSWLKVFLEGDERYRQFITAMPAASTTDFRADAL